MNFQKPIVSSFLAWSVGFLLLWGIFWGNKKEKVPMDENLLFISFRSCLEFRVFHASSMIACNSLADACIFEFQHRSMGC